MQRFGTRPRGERVWFIPLTVLITRGCQHGENADVVYDFCDYLSLDRPRHRFSSREPSYRHRPGFLIPGGGTQSGD